MARVPKMARGKNFRARGIHCCPNLFIYLFIFLPNHGLYTVRNV